MLTFLQDLRYAGRQLYKNRWISLTAILSLALGIGATVSVFSIVYAVLMNPWPYAGADRICSISLSWTKQEKITGMALRVPRCGSCGRHGPLEDVMGVNE